jgi:transcriptional regulator with XRE-family HTH domain
MPDASGDFTAQFGRRLREIRIARGLSQEDLAHLAGLHRTHISLIERNRRSVRLETLERLARALNIHPASLIPSTISAASGGLAQTKDAHHADKSRIDQLFPFVRKYQELASKHGINDIFQDNGGKLLQTLLILNLTFTGRREGNDARDEHGKEYELKTVNIDLIQSFSTHHHLNPTILAKYRSVEAWFFSIYRGIELIEIFKMVPDQLENDYFSKWEKKWHDSGGKDINNPKIPVVYVRLNGERVYSDPVDDKL